MKISRFVNNLRSGKIHTSGYAAASNQSFGATSNETFATRQAVERNRTHIGSYTQSSVVGGHKPTAYGVSGYSVDTIADSRSAAKQRSMGSGQRLDVVRPQLGDNHSTLSRHSRSAHFIEPRPRSGGPYSTR